MKTKLIPLALVASTLMFGQWNLTGNSGTAPGNNFLGTSDDKDLVLKTSNTERMRIFSGPYVNGVVIGNQSGSVNTLRARLELVSVQCGGCAAAWAQQGDFVVKTREMRDLNFLMGNNNSEDPNTDTSTPTASGITRIRFSDVVHKNSLVIFNTGKVTVGTEQYDNDPNFIFYVRKGIKAEQIKVENPATNGWADYVFKKEYKLRTLDEVENHIREKGHLPNIPSAAEVEKEGINLGEMDARLLEKIEELTLYSIDQNKKLQKQSDEIRELKQQVQELILLKKIRP